MHGTCVEAKCRRAKTLTGTLSPQDLSRLIPFIPSSSYPVVLEQGVTIGMMTISMLTITRPTSLTD
jgi:hypothetical protein